MEELETNRKITRIGSSRYISLPYAFWVMWGDQKQLQVWWNNKAEGICYEPIPESGMRKFAKKIHIQRQTTTKYVLVPSGLRKKLNKDRVTIYKKGNQAVIK